MSDIRPNNLHVLLIVPDPQKSEVIANVLRTCGVEKVLQTQHFRNIRKIVGSIPFDLVIFGDGFMDATAEEAIGFLGRLPDTQNLPLLWLTHEADPTVQQEMIQLGVTAILQDPPQQAQFHEILRSYFRKAQNREVYKLIRKASFFEEFSQEEIKGLSKLARPRRYQVGEAILSKGDAADRFFVLLKGKVEVLNFPENRYPYSIMITEGLPFGEMAILDNTERTAFCIAADECLVLEFDAKILKNTNSLVGGKIYVQLALGLARRLGRMNEILDELQSKYETLLEDSHQPVTGDQKFDSELREQVIAKVEQEAPLESCPLPPENAAPTPCKGTAEIIDDRISTQEEYDVLHRKVGLRVDFALGKIPMSIQDMIINKIFGYLTGSKLSKMNFHHVWSEKLFTPGTPRLKRALHLVVLCPDGREAYNEVFLNLPFSHRVVGLAQTGCVGSFLDSEEAIERYLRGEIPHTTILQDLEMPIDRVRNGVDVIEFLTHTKQDVSAETLFLVFEKEDGVYTHKVREAFPMHQIITVTKYFGFDPDYLSTLFTLPEQHLQNAGLLVDRKHFRNRGYYLGETFFLPDLSLFYRNIPSLGEWGALFGTIAILAKMGPDYSGTTWGSKGGAEGAVRASRAMYGIKGAQNPLDLADAINWADQNGD